ncbi:MAG: SpoVR family protein, partial [Asticcacaulis sp.]|nr:SpoVR family protein [Asticcacaulis sp.]
YALGFAMMRDIRRICENPTEEDRVWFPVLAGSDWQTSLDFAMRNFKDDSFILQYLSPKLMREFRFFAIHDDAKEKTMAVSAIHDPAGYSELRQKLARQYDISNIDPDIQVWSVDTRGDRSLTLRHFVTQERPLDDSVSEVMKHVKRLWNFPVKLESVDASGNVVKVFS